MTDNTSHQKVLGWISLKAAVKFKLTDHLLIRACQAREEGRTDRLHGLVSSPKGKDYGPSDLVTWAEGLVQRRDGKLFDIGGSVGRTLFDHLYSIGLRLVRLLGSWGVTTICVLIGLLAGWVFLPQKIFSSTEVTLPQILIPVSLGAIFVVWQLLNLMRYWISRGVHKQAGETGENPNEEYGSKILALARRVLPPYIRWNLNVGWCVFWMAVLCSMGLEYVRHQSNERDYVYRPQMALQTRIAWLHKLSTLLPRTFHLPDEALAWSDQDYRDDGYQLTNTGVPSALEIKADASFLHGSDNVYLCYTPQTGVPILKVVYAGLGQALPSAPFEQMVSAKQLASLPVQIVMITDNGGGKHMGIEADRQRLFIHAQKGIDEPLTFLADGAVVLTNKDECVLQLDSTLPERLEIRKGGVADAPLAILSFERIDAGILASKLVKPAGYTWHWFLFLFGIILTFGLVPRLIALPVFGLLYLVCKWKLYQDFSREPFKSIIAEFKKKPKLLEAIEGPVIIPEVPLRNTPPDAREDKLPHEDLLAVGYNISISRDDVRRLGGVPKFSLYERPAGDAHTNQKIMEWLGQHESFGRFLVCAKLASTPDRPFVRFLHDAVSKGYSCELAFLDMPSSPDRVNSRMVAIIRVWEDVMKKAGLSELLPAMIKDIGMKEGSNES